jgi:hypothetical protein
MKTLFIFIVVLWINFTGATKVYICDSPTAATYHSAENCRGLQKCTHQILEVTITEAKNKQLRPCKVCY